MKKLEELNEIKHKLIEAVKMELAGGIEAVQGQDFVELCEVVDMIKDIASAEESCMEASYYEVVTEAMTDSESMGYDRWRYSSGRFAPKGRGTYGYLPPYDEGDVITAEPMGYDRTRSNGTMNGNMRNTRMSNMGYTPDLTMNDGMSSKEKMDKAIDVMGDIWADASKEERKALKTCVEDLLYQMEQN